MNTISSEENLIKQLGNNVDVSMSSQWYNWNARRAIDLDDGNHPNTCGCCSGTLNENAWWKLNLRNIYPIKTIIFTGRYGEFNLRNTRQTYVCIALQSMRKYF